VASHKRHRLEKRQDSEAELPKRLQKHQGVAWPKERRKAIFADRGFHKLQLSPFDGIPIAYGPTFPPLDSIDTLNGGSVYDFFQTKEDGTLTGVCSIEHGKNDSPSFKATGRNHYLYPMSISANQLLRPDL
jgi:hypothetical protein